jgi:hypothetical protein
MDLGKAQIAPTGNAEMVGFASAGFDLAAVNTLFKLMEIVEPSLLLCRDALRAYGNNDELETIEADLARLRNLKSNLLILAMPREAGLEGTWHGVEPGNNHRPKRQRKTGKR